MNTKIITAKAFTCVIDLDDTGKIINAPDFLSKFINQPLEILEKSLRKSKFKHIKIESVEEI